MPHGAGNIVAKGGGIPDPAQTGGGGGSFCSCRFIHILIGGSIAGGTTPWRFRNQLARQHLRLGLAGVAFVGAQVARFAFVRWHGEIDTGGACIGLVSGLHGGWLRSSMADGHVMGGATEIRSRKGGLPNVPVRVLDAKKGELSPNRCSHIPAIILAPL